MSISNPHKDLIKFYISYDSYLDMLLAISKSKSLAIKPLSLIFFDILSATYPCIYVLIQDDSTKL